MEQAAVPGANIAAIAVSPAKSNVVMAIGIKDRQGLVYRSEDAGASWGQGNGQQ